MSNIANSKTEYFSLSSISGMVESMFNEKFGNKLFWITAEISSLHIHKGHCYISFIEKTKGTDEIKTEIKGIIWLQNYSRINYNFKTITGIEIKENTKILFLAKVSFDTKYGLNLIVEEIDPSYTIGQMLIERENVVRLLKEKGYYELNKNKDFPLVPQRIAVISAETSRGYEDFREKLLTNKYHYKFQIKLFQSLLQGEKAGEDMRNRLIEIFNEIHLFDIVVIVRGGGGNVNLTCFNNYRLAEAIARFPIPIITGIGHTANISVADEVAFKDCITPTDVSDFIITKCLEFDNKLMNIFEKIKTRFNEKMTNQLHKTDNQMSMLISSTNILIKKQLTFNDTQFIRFVNSANIIIAEQNNKIGLIVQKITDKIPNYIKERLSIINSQKLIFRPIISNFMEHKIKLLNNRLYALKAISDKIFTNNKRFTDDALIYITLNSKKIIEKAEKNMILTEEKIKILDPVNVLKRGYSITLKDGKNIKSADMLNEGDEVKSKII